MSNRQTFEFAVKVRKSTIRELQASRRKLLVRLAHKTYEPAREKTEERGETMIHLGRNAQKVALGASMQVATRDSSRIVGKPEVILVGPISNDKSARVDLSKLLGSVGNVTRCLGNCSLFAGQVALRKCERRLAPAETSSVKHCFLKNPSRSPGVQKTLQQIGLEVIDISRRVRQFSSVRNSCDFRRAQHLDFRPSLSKALTNAKCE